MRKTILYIAMSLDGYIADENSGVGWLDGYSGIEGSWKALYQYVFALAHGAGNELFYYGDWIRKPGVAICSCNDGLRPVIFKLEATQEPSKMDYTPVR